MKPMTQLINRIEEKDKLFFSLSDTLDVKASVSLILITFLSTQTAYFLNLDTAHVVVSSAQTLSAIALSVGGILALIILWPRCHETESIEKWDPWYQELKKYFEGKPEADQKADELFERERFNGLKKQIKHNRSIVGQKACLATWCYGCIALSVLLNLACLLLHNTLR